MPTMPPSHTATAWTGPPASSSCPSSPRITALPRQTFTEVTIPAPQVTITVMIHVTIPVMIPVTMPVIIPVMILVNTPTLSSSSLNGIRYPPIANLFNRITWDYMGIGFDELYGLQ